MYVRERVRCVALPHLAQVSGEGDDLTLVDILQPLEDDGGVQASGVGQHDLLHALDSRDAHHSLHGQRHRVGVGRGWG